jgi:hypothetical protein
MQAQRKCKYGTVLLSSFCILLFSLMCVNYSVVFAADNQFMADRHVAKGIVCNSCHKEAPPKSLVPTETCFKCHGDYTKLAEQTKKIRPNPHEHHDPNVACEYCHHAHKPSENKCNACHDFKFKVP